MTESRISEQVGAVVLLSGGLDSAVVAAMARAAGRRLHALTISYGQRHRCELEAARAVVDWLGVESHEVIELDRRLFEMSSLTGSGPIPKERSEGKIGGGIPSTFVPGRNLVFLSIGLALAQTVGAREIHLGVNAIDYSGYPDCRPEFLESFQRTLDLALGCADEQPRVEIRAPIVDMTKAEIIRAGSALGVDFALTHSCYDPDPRGSACGRCDACVLRRSGFERAGVPDPTRYALEVTT